jgi:hypothetical protein
MEQTVSALIGAAVLAGSAYLAMRPREVATAIQNYYSNLAERKRSWPRWLAWQPSPGPTASLVMAWTLIATGALIGLSGLAALFSSVNEFR